MVTGPLHPAPNSRPGPIIHVLPIEQIIHRYAVVPFEPPIGTDRIANVRLHDHRRRKHSPRPAEVRLSRIQRSEYFGLGRDVEELNRKGRFFVDKSPGLGRDGVLLAREALSGQYLTVLEDGGAAAAYEVHRAGYYALPVEVAHGVNVESVLVASHGATV